MKNEKWNKYKHEKRKNIEFSPPVEKKNKQEKKTGKNKKIETIGDLQTVYQNQTKRKSRDLTDSSGVSGFP